jgi:hypothetical protein
MLNARGRNCKASEDYTPAVIDAIREGFRLCCGPSDQQIVGQHSSHVLSPAELGMSCIEHHMFAAAKCRRSSSPLQLAETDGLADEFNTHRPPLDLAPIDCNVGFTRAIYTPLSDFATHRYMIGIVEAMSCGRSCVSEACLSEEMSDSDELHVQRVGDSVTHDATLTPANVRNVGDSFDNSLATLISGRIIINLFDTVRETETAAAPVLIQLDELVPWTHAFRNSSGRAFSPPAACVGSDNNSNSNLNDAKQMVVSARKKTSEFLKQTVIGLPNHLQSSNPCMWRRFVVWRRIALVFIWICKNNCEN